VRLYANDFARQVNFPNSCQSVPPKIFLFIRTANQCHGHAIPPRHEGRIAIVTRREAGCDGRGRIAGRSDPDVDGKSCGPGTPGLVLSAQRAIIAHDGDYEVTDTGESTHNAVNTIAQGTPVSGCTCGECACVLFSFAHRAAGASQAPGVPCALASSRVFVARTRTHTRRGIADSCFERTSGRCNKSVTSQN
jgi:hypothetical protein